MPNIETVKPVHSETGASSIERVAACPGSVRECVGLPNESTEYSDEGTRAHEVAAKIILNKDIPLSEIMAEAHLVEPVMVYVDFVDSVYGRALDDSRSVRLIEQKIDLSHKYPGVYGTADAIVYDAAAETLHVIDLKFGAGIPVEAENNPQLLYYAFMVMEYMNLDPKRVTLTIVQPRAFHPRGPVRSWSPHPLEIQVDFKDWLLDAIKKSQDPNAPLNAGEHCRFCRARTQCPAVQKIVETALTGAPPTREPLTPVQMKERLEQIAVIKAYLKGFETFAFKEAVAGRPPEGYKLVQRRGIRKWTDEAVVKSVLLKDMELTEGDIYSIDLKSPAQIEKLLSKDQKKMLGALTVTESSGLDLVPESDKRTAVKLDAQSQFAPVSEQDLKLLGE